jgi:hypothetical protein
VLDIAAVVLAREGVDHPDTGLMNAISSVSAEQIQRFEDALPACRERLR